jgi:hypothetical protein
VDRVRNTRLRTRAGPHAAALLCQGHRRDRPGLHRPGRRADRRLCRPARAADLPVRAELDSGAIDTLLGQLDIPLRKLLHGEQSFTYHRAACAGDTVSVRSRIEDIYDKKGGALEFVVKTSRATNQHGELVAELRSVLVCRH